MHQFCEWFSMFFHPLFFHIWIHWRQRLPRLSGVASFNKKLNVYCAWAFGSKVLESHYFDFCIECTKRQSRIFSFLFSFGWKATWISLKCVFVLPLPTISVAFCIEQNRLVLVVLLLITFSSENAVCVCVCANAKINHRVSSCPNLANPVFALVTAEPTKYPFEFHNMFQIYVRRRRDREV